MSDRLPLRVPARCPIFSRNWASSPAPPTPPPAAARLAPSGRLQPEHSRAAQQGPSRRQRKKRHEQASEDDRLPFRVPTRCPIFSRNWASSNFRRGVNARSCGEEDARGTRCGAMEVPWLFPPEVFPANRRPSAHSWAGISTWHRGRAARLLWRRSKTPRHVPRRRIAQACRILTETRWS